MGVGEEDAKGDGDDVCHITAATAALMLVEIFRFERYQTDLNLFVGLIGEQDVAVDAANALIDEAACFAVELVM